MKKRAVVTAVSAALLMTSGVALSWDGYDYQSGSDVEIGKGNLVRQGKTIEIYDAGDGSYRDVEVQSIQRRGGSVELEVYDYDTGEYRTLEMDGR